MEMSAAKQKAAEHNESYGCRLQQMRPLRQNAVCSLKSMAGHKVNGLKNYGSTCILRVWILSPTVSRTR
jgi:hypothetical protein